MHTSMKRPQARLSLALAAFAALTPAVAAAQPGATPPEAQQAPDAAAPSPAPVPPAPPPSIDAVDPDPADVRADYDRAFAALLRHDLATASSLFESVAARSQSADRRAASRELGRYARESSSLARDEDATSGRAGFVVTSTMASFYAGFVIDDLLNIESYEGTVGAVAASTFVGLGASIFGTRGRHISEGVASAYSVGILTGLGNGLIWWPVAGLEVEPDCDDTGCPDGDISQAYLAAGLASMAAGGIAGIYVGHRFEPTAPQARFAGLMAANGIATSLLVELVIAGEDEDIDGRDYLAGLGAGLDVGLAAGIALAPRLEWSNARVTYVMLGEAVGSLAGFSAAAIGDASANGHALLILGGMWGGFGLTTFLTQNMAPHPRYRARPDSSAISVSPMRVGRDGRGIGIAGRF